MPPNDGEKYIEFTRFLMDFLKEKDIAITDRTFFPTIFEPDLFVLVISSSNFSEIFLSIKDQLESLIQQRIEGLAKNLFLKRKEEITHFLVFGWFLFYRPKFLNNFYSQTYDRYKRFREENLRLSFHFE